MAAYAKATGAAGVKASFIEDKTMQSIGACKMKKKELLNFAYTKTGQMSKLLNSPKITVYPNEWKELDKQAQVWEDRLYYLRTMSYSTCKPHPHIEEIRELRKKLSRIDSQMNYILMQANPEYDEYWHGEK